MMRRVTALAATTVLLCAVTATALAAGPTPARLSYRSVQGTASTSLLIAVNRHAVASFADTHSNVQRRLLFTLSKPTFSRIQGSLAAADLPSLKPSYPSPPGFACGVTETVRSGGVRVSAGSGADAPRALRHLLNELATVARRHIAGAAAHSAIC